MSVTHCRGYVMRRARQVGYDLEHPLVYESTRDSIRDYFHFTLEEADMVIDDLVHKFGKFAVEVKEMPLRRYA